MILSNQARCLKCGDTPWSSHRHDFRHCECGAIAVDGGMEYLRRVGEPSDFEDMSIRVSDEHVEGLRDALSDPERNELGKLCNVVRYMRDNMGVTFESD